YWKKGFIPLDEAEVTALEAEDLAYYLTSRDRNFIHLSPEKLAEFEAAVAKELAAALALAEEEEKAKAKLTGKKQKKGNGKSPKGGKGAKKAKSKGDQAAEEEKESLEVALPPAPSALDVYHTVAKEVTAHQEAIKEERALMKAQALLVPTDVTGEPVMEELVLPTDESSQMLSSLRVDVVSRMEASSWSRNETVSAACLDSQTFLTEELEERLRKHWPRKGRTEVGSRHPREGELISHHQKACRFIRQLKDRLAEQEQYFDKVCMGARVCHTEFKEALDVLQGGLCDATSVAALQGMASRCKRMLAKFEVDCEAWVPRLTKLAREEPTKLLSSCDDLIRLCKTFANGGNYDDKEVEELDRLLQQPRQEVGYAVTTRLETISTVKKEKLAAAEKWSSFKEEHKRCTDNLSLREGLGQRYGHCIYHVL
ncbi:unnamed protein product, partial [Choristocarpus tenellus]